MSQFRTYNAGERAPINKSVNQEKGGNFRNDEGVLCLIRCYACGWSEGKLNES